MSVYLHDIPLPEAQARLEKALKAAGSWERLGIEEISLDENAAGRVLAEPVWAKISSPHYHAAAMDGFAMRAQDTVGATPSSPLIIPCVANKEERRAAYVDTGDPMPTWSDAVIPIENVEPLNLPIEGDLPDRPVEDIRHPASIRIRASVAPWSHVRTMGEDMVATQLVLPAGQVLRPVDLGAIAACGHNRLLVTRRPRVAIIPTGSELVSIGKEAKPGEIIEFNSLVLASQVNAWGGQATRFPITPDDFDSIRRKVTEASQDHDLILLNAGSSAGSEDFSARVVESLGELLVHGVAVRPGHPVILGMVEKCGSLSTYSHQQSPKNNQQSKISNLKSTIPIIGVPGYPVSAALTGEIFVAPLLARWLGRELEEPPTVTATLTHKVTSPPGDDDYMRVAVGRVGERLLAAPLSRGSGVITSLVHADGIVVIPRGSQGLASGEQVSVRLYRPLAELEHTIFAIGSHDMTLDILSQFLSARNRRLTSANVGSQGGLIALSKGEAHLAGSHLLDPETGEFNLPYIRQYLPGVPVKVVALVERIQGLLVPRGNPKDIQSLEDLSRPEVTFINRQRGAGTRVLLDYHLKRLGIAPEGIKGYNQEEFTHLAIAAAISSGRADCGLGIAAAAQALGLDFVPLFQEHYELVIPAEFFDQALLAPLFEVLEDPVFRQTVAALPGYDISRMGTLVAEVK
jgi:molybdopterin molybdotransferase/putative molybdopterin biosynthesis protein